MPLNDSCHGSVRCFLRFILEKIVANWESRGVKARHLVIPMFFSAVFVGVAQPGAADEIPSYLELIRGDWIGDGELNTAEGEVITIHEEWTAAPSEEGFFALRGTRKMGEEDQEFRWVFQKNAATDLFECEYWHTGMDEPIRFQAQFQSEGVDLLANSGDGEVRVTNSLREDDEIVGEVLLTNGQGLVTVEGTLVHQRRLEGQ